MLTLILSPFMQGIINSILAVIGTILDHTMLAPYTFSNSALPLNLWRMTDHIAWALAPIVVIYEAIQYMWHPWTGSQNSPGKLIGRAILVVMFAQASYGLLNLMLTVNNALVHHILGEPFIAALGSVSALARALQASTLALWLVVIVLIFLVALLGAVLSWGFRAAELILMVALAPIAAVLSLTDAFHGTWRWLVREFASAAFSQSMWALTVMLMLATLAAKGATGTPLALLTSLGIGGGFLRLTFQAQRWLKGMLYQQSGISQADHGIMELAAAYGAAQMASRTFAPQMALAQAALTGTGKASAGYLAAQAEIGTRQTEAANSLEYDFAPRRHQAEWQGDTAAYQDPGARGAYQRKEVSGMAAASAPAVQAAKATEKAAGQQAKPVWMAGPVENVVGAAQAADVYADMYGFEGVNNPYTRKDPPVPPNPYTGHTAEQILAMWEVPALPGKTTYGVPVESSPSEGTTQNE